MLVKNHQGARRCNCFFSLVVCVFEVFILKQKGQWAGPIVSHLRLLPARLTVRHFVPVAHPHSGPSPSTSAASPSHYLPWFLMYTLGFFIYIFLCPRRRLHSLSMCRHAHLWPHAVSFAAGPCSPWQRDLQPWFVFQPGLRGVHNVHEPAEVR